LDTPRIREGAVSFIFYFLHFILSLLMFVFILLFYFLLFYFVSNSYKPFNVCSYEKRLLLGFLCVLVFKFGGRLDLCTF
jgi:hypothetical protein